MKVQAPELAGRSSASRPSVAVRLAPYKDSSRPRRRRIFTRAHSSNLDTCACEPRGTRLPRPVSAPGRTARRRSGLSRGSSARAARAMSARSRLSSSSRTESSSIESSSSSSGRRAESATTRSEGARLARADSPCRDRGPVRTRCGHGDGGEARPRRSARRRREAFGRAGSRRSTALTRASAATCRGRPAARRQRQTVARGCRRAASSAPRTVTFRFGVAGSTSIRRLCLRQEFLVFFKFSYDHLRLDG